MPCDRYLASIGKRLRSDGRRPPRRWIASAFLSPTGAQRGSDRLKEAEQLLRIEDLRLSVRLRKRTTAILSGLSLRVQAGEILGLVGESGAGKSQTALAILGLLHPAMTIESGKIEFRGRSLLGLPQEELRRVRGRQIALIHQEPQSSLNPLMLVGRQVAETRRCYFQETRAEAKRMTLQLMQEAGLEEPERVFYLYPHELSGGMRQRVLIAMALSGRPKLILADEATSALDGTTRARILCLLKRLSRRHGISILFISHELESVSMIADRVAVMRGGRVVEEGPCPELFTHPQHEYTKELIRAFPGESGI